MELTRRCDYACRILRSAHRHDGEYISIAQISEEEEIPYAFARTIQHDLSAAGYVKTVRGAHGGLALAVDPADITLQQLLGALQGDVSIAPCVVDPDMCGKSPECAFHKTWAAADRLLNLFFSNITLADVLECDGDTGFIDEALKQVNLGMSAGSEARGEGRPVVAIVS